MKGLPPGGLCSICFAAGRAIASRPYSAAPPLSDLQQEIIQAQANLNAKTEAFRASLNEPLSYAAAADASRKQMDEFLAKAQAEIEELLGDMEL